MADTISEKCGCSFIPSYVFEDIASADNADDELKELAELTLELMDLENLEKELDEILRLLDELDEAEAELEAATPKLIRKIYTLTNKKSDLVSEALLIRDEGVEASVQDSAADKCYEYFGDFHRFFAELFDWNSVDDKGLPLVGLVHYGSNVPNALWHPGKKLMWFGDGFSKDTVDASKPSSNFGGYFGNFYDSLELVGHELMHGITSTLMSPFNYGETGALVEHIADAFGLMIKQYKLNQTVQEADWLIGQAIILPELKNMALRSFKDPGRAYVLPGGIGKDEQISHYQFFKEITKDSGGVHIYSGIPNHAFYQAAMQIGGYSWEILGKIWWKTLTEGKVDMSRYKGTFAPFARKTVEFAGEHGEGVKNAVLKAWQDVGVLKVV